MRHVVTPTLSQKHDSIHPPTLFPEVVTNETKQPEGRWLYWLRSVCVVSKAICCHFVLVILLQFLVQSNDFAAHSDDFVER